MIFFFWTVYEKILNSLKRVGSNVVETNIFYSSKPFPDSFKDMKRKVNQKWHKEPQNIPQWLL